MSTLRLSAYRILTGLLLAFGASSTLRAQDGAEVFVPLGHRSALTAVTAAPSGEVIATASQDGLVKVWESSSGRSLHTLQGHQGSVTALAMSPDERWIASVGRDRTLKIWSRHSGQLLRSVLAHDNIVLAVAAVPDSRNWITAGFDRRIKLWDGGSGQLLRTFEEQTAAVRAVSVSVAAATLVAGGDDGMVSAYRLTGERLSRFRAGDAAVVALALSPPGDRCATASQDGKVRIWNLVSGQKVLEWTGHQGAVATLSFSPDGLALATGGADGQLKLWRADTGRLIDSREGHAGELAALAYSARGSYLATVGSDRALRVWPLEAGVLSQPQVLRSRTVDLRAVAISRSGTYRATAGHDGRINVWDGPTGRLVRSFKAHEGAVESLRFLPDERHLVSGGQDRRIKIWEAGAGREVRTLVGHTGGVLSLDVSADGRWLASGSFDTTVRLWDMASGEARHQLIGHRSSVRSVAFSPDGRLLASGSTDETVRLWDVGRAALIRSHAEHTNRVTRVLFGADGNSLISAGEDSAVVIRDLGQPGKEPRILRGHASPVRALVRPSMGRLASLAADGTLVLWDEASGARLAGRQLGIGQIGSADVGGTEFLVSGELGTVLSLARDDAGERVRFFSFDDGHWLVITPEGYFTASEQGSGYLSVRLRGQVHALDQFLERFYRPDRVSDALRPSAPPALGTAGIMPTPALPPPAGTLVGAPARPTASALDRVRPAPAVILEDLPRESEAAELTLSVQVKDLGGGIGDIRVYLNEAAVVVEPGGNGGRDLAARQYRISLLPGTNVIKVAAFNEDNSMQGPPATQTVQARLSSARRPSVHALVVGIQEFSNSRLNLEYAVADAKLFADVISNRTQGLFQSTHVRLLTSRAETTRDALAAALKEIQEKIQPEDMFIFYVASHGTVDDGEYFLITSNVGSISTARLRQEAVSQARLREWLGNIPATKKLIVLDTCNSGQMVDAMQPGVKARALNDDRAAKMLSRSVGSTVLSAATSQQEALEGYQGHGLFTWVLAEGLRGKADKDNDGFVKTTEIADYVDEVVPELAEQVFKYRQYPVTSPTGQQFPLVRTR